MMIELIEWLTNGPIWHWWKMNMNALGFLLIVGPRAAREYRAEERDCWEAKQAEQQASENLTHAMTRALANLHTKNDA